jgi:hypothetical protein
MTQLMAFGTQLHALQCGSCGVVHAIPEIKYAACLEEGGYWTCPNGHSRGYEKGRLEREAVRRERDRLKQENARLEDEVAAARRETEKAQKKLKGHQRRVAAGVCPCCNRTFVKIAMHMKSKHPEFGQPNVVPLTAAKA